MDETGCGDFTNPKDDHGFIRQVSTSPDDIGFIRQVSTSASSLGGNVDEFGDGEDSDFVRQVSTASAQTLHLEPLSPGATCASIAED
jgi:hypothetical protein